MALSSAFNNFVSSLKPKKAGASSINWSANSMARGVSLPSQPRPGVSSPSALSKTTPFQSSNQAATSPQKPTPTVNSGTSQLPPAGQQYVQNLYDNKTGARTAYGASMGVPDMLGGKPVPPTSSGGTGNPSPMPTPGSTPTAPTSPYKKYLESLFDSDKLNTAMADTQKANLGLAKVKNRYDSTETEARRRYEELLDESGGLKSGAQESATMDRRRSNQELADIALQVNAASNLAGVYNDSYKQIVGAGKDLYGIEQDEYERTKPVEVGGVLYQPQPDGTYKSVAGAGASADGFTLGKDQVRYDAQGNVIASGPSGGSGSDEAPTIKTFGQTDYAWNPQTSQWDPVNLSDISPQVKIDKAQSVIDLIKTLGKEAEGFGGAVGAKGPSSLFGLKGDPIAGTAAAGYVNRFNQLVGMLTLENMGIMKGVLSDADIKIIKEASTALNRNGREEDFITELGKLEKIMKKVIDKGGAMSGGTSGGSTGGSGGLFDW